MNVQQLRNAIKDLPGDMKVTGWTNGDTEFEVAVATVFERLPTIKACLMIGNDPNEVGKHEKLLFADDVEGY
jgi:hypothetical protein